VSGVEVDARKEKERRHNDDTTTPCSPKGSLIL
jgi:hypothetical protein